jgi:hypothetical protein
MTLRIAHREKYSRGQLLLRTFFGWIYIGIPHGFLLFFLSIWSAILAFVTFWVVLFTARFPQSIFEYQVGLYRWQLRAQASLANLLDGYPAFGVRGASGEVAFEVAQPERVSRGLTLLRAFLGWVYVTAPHGFCLFFRLIGTGVLMFLAWWAVLFTGRYPERWHAFNVGTFRWSTRVGLYLGYFTDEYPRFTGKEYAPREAEPVSA